MARPRIGVWLIGAKGGVASTTTVGLVALSKGLIGDAGLVSQLPRFASLDLAPWKDFVLGGHDIRDVTLYDEARRMHTESRAIDHELLERCKPDLDRIGKNHRPGTVWNVGDTIAGLAETAVRDRRESPRQAIERIQSDLGSF